MVQEPPRRICGEAMMRLVVVIALLTTGCIALRTDVERVESRMYRLERQTADLDERQSRESRELRDRLERAESESKAIRQTLAGQGAKMDQLARRVDVLEGRTEEVHTSAGKINVNAARMAALEQEQVTLREMITRLEQRLAVLEQQAAPRPSVAGKEVDENALYKVALQAHNEGEYEKARQGFLELLAAKPNSKLAPNAEFWLGEGYFKTKDFVRALEHYMNVIKKYPKGEKYCAAVLKAGITLDEMKEGQKAKVFYTEVVDNCAGTDQAKEAARRLKK